MMKIRACIGWIVWVMAAGIFAGLTVAGAQEGDAPKALDAEADAALRRMGDFLGKAPFFSVHAEVWQDVDLRSGQRVQAGRTVEIQVRRPDRFHAEMRSTRRSRGLFYDGKSINLVNRVEKFFGVIPVPATLDAALDAACEQFGITMPLEDLVVSDPYGSAMRNVTSGIDVGPVTVLGVACEHLAFVQGTVDWQVWIEQGATPVPRKMVITYKDEKGSPEYTAMFSQWDFKTVLSDSEFLFQPPSDMKKIGVGEIKRKNQAGAAGGKAR